jgi:hypothetical protein
MLYINILFFFQFCVSKWLYFSLINIFELVWRVFLFRVNVFILFFDLVISFSLNKKHSNLEKKEAIWVAFVYQFQRLGAMAVVCVYMQIIHFFYSNLYTTIIIIIINFRTFICC